MREFIKRRQGFMNILIATTISAIFGLSTFIFNNAVKASERAITEANKRVDKQELILERMADVQVDIKEILARQDERLKFLEITR